MFIYATCIRLRDTDATGVLFFTEQLRLALEAFESYLKASGYTLSAILEDKDYLLPVVHAEADYAAPLTVGDEVEVHLKVERIGTSSFTLGTRIFDVRKQRDAGTTSVTHVALSRKEKSSIPIPKEFLQVLEKISAPV
jgi:1,4-dihydroxy-2-naphthoyl-CoA hydrolase